MFIASAAGLLARIYVHSTTESITIRFAVKVDDEIDDLAVVYLIFIVIFCHPSLKRAF